MDKSWLQIRPTHLRAASLSLFLLVCASSARAANPLEILSTTKWVVNWANSGCELMRIGEDNPTALKVSHNPAEGTVSVTMGNRTWKHPPKKDAEQLEVVLFPSGEKFSGPSHSEPAREGARVVVAWIGESFLDRLSSARGIAIESGGSRLLEMSFGAASAAVQQMHKCSKDLLARWGIDAAALAALRQRAVPLVRPSRVFGFGDYPDDALRAGIEGEVIARYDIGEDGKVGNCSALEPKPDRILVATTCRILTDRVSYKPALGPEGRPVATQSVAVITWRILSSQ